MITSTYSRLRIPLSLILAASVVCWAPGQGAGLGINTGSFSLGEGSVDIGCGSVTIAAGASLSLANGHLDMVGDVLNNGTLHGNQGTIELNGNWTNSGTVIPGTSTIEILEDCGTNTTLAGDSEFWNLIADGVAKTLFFSAGASQKVGNTLTLRGAGDAGLLLVRSTNPGEPGFLELAQAGMQLIEFVDVRDNHAALPGQHLALGPPAAFNSIDSGGNFLWFLNDLNGQLPDFIPIPVLSLLGLLLLAMLLFTTALGGWRRTVKPE